MSYPPIDEPECGAYCDNLCASAKQCQNDGSSEAECEELCGVCTVGTHSTHFGDVMMSCVCSPQQHIAVRPSVDPVIEKL